MKPSVKKNNQTERESFHPSLVSAILILKANGNIRIQFN
jgi:hypothetical protein